MVYPSKKTKEARFMKDFYDVERLQFLVKVYGKNYEYISAKDFFRKENRKIKISKIYERS